MQGRGCISSGTKQGPEFKLQYHTKRDMQTFNCIYLKEHYYQSETDKAESMCNSKYLICYFSLKVKLCHLKPHFNIRCYENACLASAKS
jgi:hypothetical protein